MYHVCLVVHKDEWTEEELVHVYKEFDLLGLQRPGVLFSLRVRILMCICTM